ncbi:unnamed protein product [Sphagnum jensenii]|uniref:Uncharacterized protein n=1 Tax=Sphagnum jensenii TaxID=128206 RepID=A0ABP1B2S2_9BRYO
MKVKDVIRKGRGVRRGPGLDEVDAEILVGSSACQNVVGSACRDREVREGGKYWKVGEGDTEMQSREDAEKHFTLKLGYISLLMATEQVNGIVHVTWTRATFLEFIDAIQVEELGELGHFLIFIVKEFNVKKNAGLQIEFSSIDGSCQLCGQSAVVSFNYYSATPICEIDSEIRLPYENQIVLHGLFYEGTLVEVGQYGFT